MKSAYIVHGWEGSPSEPLLAWFAAELRSRGYTVVAPAMPNPEKPTIAAWVGKLKEVVGPSPDAALIGHSIGCQAILRYLETLPEGASVGQVVLIAPWIALDEQTVEEEGEEVREIARPWMETPIDFAKVKARAASFTAIFSDNDSYVPLAHAEVFERELGAKIVIEQGKGHFDPSSGVTMLPSALEKL